MKVDNRFASKVAVLAAELVADGCPYGTFEDPDSFLPVGTHVEGAMIRAGYLIWRGPGWWRLNMSRASACLGSIRYLICDGDSDLSFNGREQQARARWDELEIDETVLMLLFCSQALKQRAPTAINATWTGKGVCREVPTVIKRALREIEWVNS